MKTRLSLAFVVVFLCCFISGDAVAQSLLNKIQINHCNPEPEKPFNSQVLETLIEAERRRGLILDARPFAINQSTGKLRFDGKIGRVSVVHMNPFVYRYKISVAQKELVSSAVSDFIDILLPPGLRSVGRVDFVKFIVPIAANLEAIEKRLDQFSPANCPAPNEAGCVALKTMKEEFDTIRVLMNSSFDEITGGPPPAVSTLTGKMTTLRDEQADAHTACTRAQDLNNVLTAFNPADYLNRLETTKDNKDRVTSLANDLAKLADRYFEDDKLKGYDAVRCGGFNCARQFKDYAKAVVSVLQQLESPLEDLIDKAQALKAMLDLTEKMKGKEGLFARTFEVTKKFELSEATISIARVKIKTNNTTSDQSESLRQIHVSPSPDNSFIEAKEESGRKMTRKKTTTRKIRLLKKTTAKTIQVKVVTGDVNESIQIGRPRFLVSGGLVYSPLPRQTFVSATGFSRDAQGNPVGEGDKTIVSFGENSPRRLLPMVFLNSRLLSFNPASIYFTLGVTAKKDRDIDVEYLLGPSVSMLNDRAMFTFGAYAGKTQRLVPDVKIGEEIPESAGKASLFTKRYTWKPGFSFSYVFSNVSKRPQEGGSGGTGSDSASATDEFKDEIRIGSIPFNLAMGLAYTSLEDRSFDEILGFARDRHGNRTNDLTLTRIVGLSTSSNYRLVPLAMLHSRLLNFGRHSFYLTSGVTGKKESDNIEIEYLLGGSVNLYQRKLFFTFGTFAGKQQVLGGDMFLGGKLNPIQNVTTESRYFWKPAFAFSYDISKILPRGAKR